MAALRAHLAGLNDWSASFDACPVTDFKLEEEIVSFAVSAGAATGRVNLSLEERSAYPRTGALAFADGSEELVRAVETASTAISRGAALDAVVRALVEGLPVDAALVQGLPAPPALAAASVPTAKSDDDMEDDDDDDDDDDEMDDDMDYGWERGAELENQLLRLRHSWELKDQERRQLAGEPAPAEAGAPEAAPAEPRSGGDGGVKAPKKGEKAPAKRGAHQIFTAHEATRILCNELFDLMKEKLEGFDGIDADCVDRDVHTWRVRITDVNEASPLHGDLAALGRRLGGGAAAIELELRFTPDMHPFYPAFVKVVRPRFEGYAAEALMAHPLLTLGGWDPMKSVKWLLRFAQGFLETHGRVALDDARNDAAAHPSAYAAAEHALCRLELLSGARPAWAAAHPALFAGRGAEVDTERVRELNFGKRQKSDDEKAKGGWARGVGYGHSATEGGATWDIVATEKAQEQVDVEMRALLGELARAAAAGELAAEVAEASCLRALLWERLKNGSLLDMGKGHERTSMYLGLLDVLTNAASRPELRAVIARAPPGDDGATGSVVAALEAMRPQAAFFAERGGGAADGAAAGAAASSSAASLKEGAAAPPAEDLERTLALRILEAARAWEGHGPPAAAPTPAAPAAPAAGGGRATPKTRSTRSSAAAAAAASGGAAPPSGSAEPRGGADEEEEYVRAMRPLQFEAAAEIQGSKYGDAPAGSSQARTKRLAMEAADMVGGSLPCSASSTTWARVDERSMHLWRAMISGPEDTPYAGGLFTFDVMCPSDYPNRAPKVNLATTGGGTVRFNPNLYNCGKVCLSLLGTWQGEQGEAWQPKTSTLLQVFISVQALILVPDPFFNEPGYERIRGTAEGDRESRRYNETIREARGRSDHTSHPHMNTPRRTEAPRPGSQATVAHAMIAQLRKPAAELKEAVELHFRLRKRAIIATVRAWASDAANSAQHTKNLERLEKELCKELNKLG